LHADGSIACLGANFYGQIGDGTTLTRATSTKVTLPAAAKSIGVGYAHSCALLVNGQVMCWGDNIEGEIGDLTGVNHPTPTAPAGFGGETPAALAVGTYHNCVLTTAPNVWCWGGNFNGGVGDGTYDDAFGPLKVTVQ
jgi:alpha-tubulin suppressor-like RCC1 family protein